MKGDVEASEQGRRGWERAEMLRLGVNKEVEAGNKMDVEAWTEQGRLGWE